MGLLSKKDITQEESIGSEMVNHQEIMETNEDEEDRIYSGDTGGKYGSLKWKFVRMMFFLSFMLFVGVGLMLFFNSRKYLIKSVGENLSQLTESTMRQIDSRIYNQIYKVRLWGKMPVIANSVEDNNMSADLTNRLKEMIIGNPHFKSIVVANIRGVVVAATQTKEIKENVKERQWWKNIVEGVLLSGFVSDIKEGNILELSAPILKGNSLAGVLKVDYDMAGIQKLINEVLLGDGGFLKLTKANGSVIVTHDRFLDNIFSEGLIDSALAASEGFLGEWGKKGFSIEKMADREGNLREFLIGYAPSRGYKSYYGHNWVLFSFRPTEEAFVKVLEMTKVYGVASIIVFLISIILSYLMAARFTKPINEIISVFKDVSMEKYHSRAAINTNDEIQLLGDNLNKMLDDIVSLIQTREMRDALQLNIKKLLRIVNEASDGNLRPRADVTSDIIGNVSGAYNIMLENIGRLIMDVRNTSIEVNKVSHDILLFFSEVKLDSERQNGDIINTSFSMEGISSSIRVVAENAASASKSAKQANEAAKKGTKAVDESINGINKIRDDVQYTSKKIKKLGEQSMEINSIVNLISGIAGQTNMLALNAAIEAARAGQQGKGFAVIADEIRNLAERATQATNDISLLVKAIQDITNEAVIAMERSLKEVETGKHLVDSTCEQLKEIEKLVGNNTNQILLISNAVQRQVESTESVASAVSNISNITKKTSQGVQKTSLSVKSLSEVSKRLLVNLERFKI